MPYQMDIHQQFTQGSILAFPDDLLPEGSFRLLKNLRLDRVRGVPTLRPGIASASAGALAPLAPTVPWIGTTFSRAADYRYIQVHNGIQTSLARMNATWGSIVLLTVANSITPISDVNWVDGGFKNTLGVYGDPGIWKFIVGPGRFKDSGVLFQNFGIDAPNAPPASATLGARSQIILHNMDAVGGWTGNGVSAGPTADTTVKQVGTASISFSVAADTVGSIKLGLAVSTNLDTLNIPRASGFDNGTTSNRTDRLIHTTVDFWYPTNVRAGMRLVNNADGCTGTITSIASTVNNNDTLVCAGGFTGGVENDFDFSDSYTVYDDLVKDDDFIHAWVRVDSPDRLEWLQFDFDRDTTDPAAAFYTNYYTVRLPSAQFLTQGRDNWTELEIRKSEFQKIGTVRDWKDIRSVRISARTSRIGGCTVWVDDLSLVGGYGIEGEIEYTAIYRNTITGCRSNPPLSADDQVLHTVKVKAKRHPITLNLTNIANPTDSQINIIEIYRRGGVLTNWTKVEQLVPSITSWTDTLHDAMILLNHTLETDNHRIPSTAVTIFGPGGYNRLFAIVDRNKVHVSKAWEAGESRGENWPKFTFFLAGDGSTQAMNGIVIDTNGFVYTEDACFFFTGRGPNTFIPIPVPESRGLAARFALTHGDGQIFFLSQDGIYSQRGIVQTLLTGHLAPFFNGETVAGIAPLAKTLYSDCRLTFLPHPTDPLIMLAYRSTASGNPFKRLVLKRNAQTGQYTDAFFDESTNIQVRSLFTDLKANRLYGAGTDSAIYELEVDTATTDVGISIPVEMRTPAHNQGSPRNRKTYNQMFVEANTNSQTLTATAIYDKGLQEVAVGSVSGNSDDDQTLLITGFPSDQRYNVALKLAASVTSSVKIFRYGIHYFVEDEERTFLDSDEISFPERHSLRFVDLILDASATVTVEIYIDGILRDTRPIFVSAGHKRYRHRVPDGLKGHVFRFVVSSTGVFKRYGAVAHFRPWGVPRGLVQREILGGAA